MKKPLLLTVIIVFMLLFTVNIYAIDEVTTAQITIVETTSNIQSTTVPVSSTSDNKGTGDTLDDIHESADISSSDDESSDELTFPAQNNDDDDYFSFGSINWGVYIIFSIVAAIVVGSIIILANPTDRKK